MTSPSLATDALLVFLSVLANAGVRLAPDGASLRYWSPVPLTPELRASLIEHKPALLEYLSVWNLNRAVALQVEADGLVASLEASGSDPEIQAAAERYIAAFNVKDMAGVRLSIFDLEDRARRLAAGKRTGENHERQ